MRKIACKCINCRTYWHFPEVTLVFVIINNKIKKKQYANKLFLMYLKLVFLFKLSYYQVIL